MVPPACLFNPVNSGLIMSKRFLWRRIASDKSLFRRGLPGQVRRRRLHVESLEQRVVLDAGGFDVGGLAFGALDALGAGSAVAAAGALASDSASLIPLQVILGPMKFEYPQFPKMHINQYYKELENVKNIS